MKEESARRLDSLAASREPRPTVSVEDGEYSFPSYCGRLILKNGKDGTLPVDLNATLFRANLKEVKRSLSFLPQEASCTWRFGKVSIRTKGSMF